MKQEALFINGVYEEVLREILSVQAELPEQILFLQPFSSGAISRLRDEAPTVDDPMQLFISVTTDLPTVEFTAEIVGWDDKRHLSDARRRVLSRLIWTLQPNEGGLYDATKVEGAQSVNLLHIRRLRELEPPFPVSQLIKTSDQLPVSEGRTTAGGWAYVRNRTV
ncbi:MAG TPA: hypothetical protein VNX60_13335 [Candidatus Acidoferrum sp.]|jgi:hypothetical protein|nr:hypothetical protein [Candidatus Acidoferrum sp.]